MLGSGNLAVGPSSRLQNFTSGVPAMSHLRERVSRLPCCLILAQGTPGVERRPTSPSAVRATPEAVDAASPTSLGPVVSGVATVYHQRLIRRHCEHRHRASVRYQFQRLRRRQLLDRSWEFHNPTVDYSGSQSQVSINSAWIASAGAFQVYVENYPTRGCAVFGSVTRILGAAAPAAPPSTAAANTTTGAKP